MLQYHHQNAVYKMGSDCNHFNVSLIARDKVIRRCPQNTTVELLERRAEAESNGRPLLGSLTPYR